MSSSIHTSRAHRYLMRRQSLVYDGNPPPEKYDFGE